MPRRAITYDTLPRITRHSTTDDLIDIMQEGAEIADYREALEAMSAMTREKCNQHDLRRTSWTLKSTSGKRAQPVKEHMSRIVPRSSSAWIMFSLAIHQFKTHARALGSMRRDSKSSCVGRRRG